MFIDYSNLTPEQRQRAREQILSRAQAARAQALRDLFAAVLYGLRTAAGSATALTRAVGGAFIARAGKWWPSSFKGTDVPPTLIGH